jgi:chromosome segregation ATPase
MQSDQIKQQLAQVEQCVQQATQACQADQAAPQELKDSVRELGDQSRQAHEFMQGTKDEASMRQCIDDLEESSDRAKEACQSAGNVSQKLKDAVIRAHRTISQLKHQLH